MSGITKQPFGTFFGDSFSNYFSVSLGVVSAALVYIVAFGWHSLVIDIIRNRDKKRENRNHLLYMIIVTFVLIIVIVLIGVFIALFDSAIQTAKMNNDNLVSS